MRNSININKINRLLRILCGYFLHYSLPKQDKIRILTVISLFIAVSACDDLVMYNRSEILSDMPIIEVFVDEDEYYNMLQNKTTRTEAPVKIIYNGKTSTGFIRSSGGGSRLHPRWSYRVELKCEFEVEGLNTFSLSSQSLDPTMIHTTIVSRLYSLRGIPVFRNKHVFLKINNQDMGLYLIIERINEEFFRIRNIPTYEIYKAGLDSDFSFDAPEHPRFTYEKKVPGDNNYTHLFNYINAIDTCGIVNIEQSLGKYMDIDSYIQYHAISSITNNNDAFKNNYYLQRSTVTAPYKFFPWDFDRSFDPVHDIGLAGENTLFDKLSQNQTIREKYVTELQFNLDNYFREDIIFPIIDSTAMHIKQAYNLDPFLGSGGHNLEYQVNELKQFITERIEFFRGYIDDF